MADNLSVDIVHNLVFEVQGRGMETATASLQQQEKLVEELRREVEALKRAEAERSRAAARSSEQARRATEAEKRAKEDARRAAEAKARAEVRGAEASRRASEQAAAAARRAAQEERQREREVQARMQRTKQLFTTIAGSFGIAFGVGTAISGIRNWLSEAQKMGRELEGVERAFNRLNRPELLAELREQTRGTVTDLELMKQAVQFNNFKLPLDKLGVALAFARSRAVETGQSVDYLVNSIVAGLARQSTMILDNLGISAKEINAEFQRTGDFAGAAFSIIEKGAEKAADALLTVSERQQQLAVQQQNLQAQSGRIWDSIINDIREAGLNLDQLLGGGAIPNFFTIRAAQRRDANRELNQARKEEEESQKLSAEVQKGIYRSFLADKVQAAKDASEEVRKAQLKEVNSLEQGLKAGARRIYAHDQKTREAHLKGISAAFQQFREETARPENLLETLTAERIQKLSRAELQEFLEQAKTMRNAYAPAQTELITKTNQLVEQLEAAIAVIDGTTKSTRGSTNATKDNTKAVRENNQALIEAYKAEQNASDIRKERVLWEERAEIYERQQELLKIEKERWANMNALERAIHRVNKAQSDGLAKLPSATDISREQFSIETERYVAREIQNPFILTPEQEAEQARLRAERMEGYQKMAEQLVSITAEMVNTQLELQRAAVDKEISIREMRYQRALQLAERGNTEALAIEEKYLEQAIAKREQIARRQLIVNSALAASQSIVAIATTAAESGVASVATIPLVIAALSAGFGIVTALSKDYADVGFYRGGYTGDGNPRDPAGVVHKGEYVMPADKTKRYRPLLEAIHEGRLEPRAGASSTTIDIEALEKAIKESATDVDVHFDEHGVGVLASRAMQKNRRRWAR